MAYAASLRSILINDDERWRILGLVRSVGCSDCWVGAGFVRDAVWDHLHGRAASPPLHDVDVLWFDPSRTARSEDEALEAALRSLEPRFDWSVKNQARMHGRNDDPPYASIAEAMRHWPETATAVAVRRTGVDACDVLAPFGLDDLFNLIVRPTPRFLGEKHSAYLDRVEAKGWLAAWPRLRMEAGCTNRP